MARIQILELPRKSVDDEIPFAVIIDQNEMTRIESHGGDVLRSVPRDVQPDQLTNMAESIGARVVLVFDGTVEVG